MCILAILGKSPPSVAAIATSSKQQASLLFRSPLLATPLSRLAAFQQPAARLKTARADRPKSSKEVK